MKRIRKIHFGAENTTIIYDENVGENSWQKTSIDSPEMPKREFENAMQELAQDVVRICELNMVDLDVLTVTGITLIYGKNPNGYEVMITSKKPVMMSNSPRNIASPKIELGVINDDDSAKDYKISLKEKINLILNYAENYVNGDRIKIQPDTANLFEQE